jgi:ABC-type glycerol-3-phosphate transport system permease component
MRVVICFQIPTTFWTDVRNTRQVFNVYSVHDVRQTARHISEPSVPEPSSFEGEIAIENLKIHKLPRIGQIPAQLIQAGGNNILRSEMHKPINSIWKKRNNYHSNGWNLLLYLFIKRVIKLTVTITAGYHCYQLHTKFESIFFSQC